MAQNRQYTCFVISPLGGEESSERSRSDSVLNFLVIPVLTKCGFTKDCIIRSDKISETGKISEQIVGHIKNDDLCVIDMTDLNANVMYEYGLRMGYGKPYIVLAQKGQTLPFDVHDERTIFYDVESVPGLMRAQEVMERFVDSLEQQGFIESVGTESVTSLSERLKRIEDKLDSALNVIQKTGGGGNNSVPGNAKLEDILRQLSPIQAFNYALTQRDLSLGEDLMPMLKQTLSQERYIDQVVAQLVAMGSNKAARIFAENWDVIFGEKSELTFKQRYEEIGCYISYCNRADCEPEYLERVLKTIEDLMDAAPTSKERAGLYNQKNRIYFGAYTTLEGKGEVHPEYLEEAVQALEKAIKLNDREPSYYYNLATCLRKRGDLDGAVTAISKCMELDSNDDDHLKLAYELYREKKDPRADHVLQKLQEVNPYLATLLRRKR